MRSYLIEDLTKENAATISTALTEKGFAGPIEGIWYLPVDNSLLEPEQQEHLDECGPYMMALEQVEQVETDDYKLELLVRAREKMRCSCVAYATPKQRETMIDFLDSFIRELDIPV